MLQFVLRRILQVIPILLGVTIVTFALVQIMPGSIADMLVPPSAPQGLKDEINRIYGLDRSLFEQYFLWLGQLLSGNLGVSLVSSRPVAGEIFAAMLNTLQITLMSAVIGFSLGILFGALAALNAGKWPDRLFTFVSIAGVSVPHYWLAILLVTIFSVQFNVLPAQGMGPPGFPLSWEQWRPMIMPIFTLSLIPMGVVGRLVRASVLEVLSQEFVQALGAKGLRNREIRRHIAKNAAPAVLAVMGLQFGYLLGGSILVETVFNWPGTGKLLNQAIFTNDMPIIQATVLVLSIMFVLVNLMVDVAQAAIDPRMRR
ncbi:MAG: transporter permease [Devosia sp.]|jgi:peptide/nickel transport system permease protein|nr:transporter permease [Devosia sp.]